MSAPPSRPDVLPNPVNTKDQITPIPWSNSSPAEGLPKVYGLSIRPEMHRTGDVPPWTNEREGRYGCAPQ